MRVEVFISNNRNLQTRFRLGRLNNINLECLKLTVGTRKLTKNLNETDLVTKQNKLMDLTAACKCFSWNYNLALPLVRLCNWKSVMALN